MTSKITPPPLETPEENGSLPATDVAAYLADMLLELKELAHRSGFETLSEKLLEAHREANWRKVARR